MLSSTSRRTVALAAILALALVTPAAAAPAELAGTSVIEGSRSAVTRVSVPRDAVVDAGAFFTASRAGRVQGLLLRPAGAPVTDIRSVHAAQVNFCFEIACRPAADGPTRSHMTVTGFDPVVDGTTYRVPKGVYDLYLIADGAPSSVTLRLLGLDGSTTVRPQTPAKVDVVAGTPESPQTGFGPIAFASGVVTPVQAPGGALFTATTVAGQGPASVAMGTCMRPDGPSAAGTYHGCGGPAGAALGPDAFVLPEPAPFARAASTWALVHPRPSWGTGGFVEGNALSWETGLVSFALTYSTSTDDRDDSRPVPDAPPAPSGGVVSMDRQRADPPARADGPGTSQGGATPDRTPCRPTLRTRRTAAMLRLTVRVTETCVVSSRLLRGKRTIANAAGVARPGRATTYRLRAPRRGKLKLVIHTTDAAGNRSRRSLAIR